MARPVEFNQKKVIDSVVKLFWEHGYEATSMKNISEVTGLQPGSLYAAFGNKRALFLTAIDTYFEASIENLKAILFGEGTPLQRIRELFLYTVDDTCRKDTQGCMLVNTLLETPADDEALHTHIARMFRVVEEAIREVLIEAAACGELAAGKDPAIQAKLLINNIYGLRVYGKLQPKGPAMMEMVEDLVASLK
ncbi:Transcriptional regulator, AcrR family [hydrothermal vent metagenome]|uniref:Transcriptional regulator, AcrR family n=1 Tax=hydrothermal vent metagenome TaxID=652676 RepID=A0A3B0Y833_9ZZZZ